jgi:SAM-dependent methyltransferase
MTTETQPDFLNWTGYVYGGLAHSTFIQYDEQSELTGEASVRRGLKRMGLAPEFVAGRRVMDVGTGFYSLGFHRLGAHVEHRDISVRSVEALNAYASARGHANLQSIHTDLVQDLLPADHFDLIYLSGIFQHFEDPARALRNVTQALTAGGYLYVDIYRSGRWRWFVVDVLRRIVEKSWLYDVLARFIECCAVAEKRSFHLRQVELLIDDLFVEHLNLFHPTDLSGDAAALGLELVRPVTSMDLQDGGDFVDHSLLFAHVFNTLTFQKVGTPGGRKGSEKTRAGRSQLEELGSSSGSYHGVLDITADFILAHRAGKFSREEAISHVVHLFRMAHPCLPGDPYFEPGQKEPSGAVCAEGDAAVASRRHAMWCTFLANVMNVTSPIERVRVASLGYELVRFLPPSAAR